METGYKERQSLYTIRPSSGTNLSLAAKKVRKKYVLVIYSVFYGQLHEGQLDLAVIVFLNGRVYVSFSVNNDNINIGKAEIMSFQNV